MASQNVPEAPFQLIDQDDLVERLMDEWRPMLGKDYARYRNHVYRVLNYTHWYNGYSLDPPELIAIACCFHDIGIWANGTFDYLRPSWLRCRAWLQQEGKASWADEIFVMIDNHHRWSKVKGRNERLGNAFRKADWVDVSMGLRSFKMPRRYRKQVRKAFPWSGFHGMLFRLFLSHFIRNPFNPLPMFKS